MILEPGDVYSIDQKYEKSVICFNLYYKIGFVAIFHMHTSFINCFMKQCIL